MRRCQPDTRDPAYRFLSSPTVHLWALALLAVLTSGCVDRDLRERIEWTRQLAWTNMRSTSALSCATYSAIYAQLADAKADGQDALSRPKIVLAALILGSRVYLSVCWLEASPSVEAVELRRGDASVHLSISPEYVEENREIASRGVLFSAAWVWDWGDAEIPAILTAQNECEVLILGNGGKPIDRVPVTVFGSKEDITRFQEQPTGKAETDKTHP